MMLARPLAYNLHMHLLITASITIVLVHICRHLPGSFFKFSCVCTGSFSPSSWFPFKILTNTNTTKHIHPTQLALRLTNRSSRRSGTSTTASSEGSIIRGSSSSSQEIRNLLLLQATVAIDRFLNCNKASFK